MKEFLAVVGPTASGKTAVADQLSKKLPLEMICCDSMQVYRGMPILTQAPKKKSHLTAFLDPSEEYSAARFRSDATVWIEKILKKQKRPLLVGGTGLYLRALLYGLFENEGPASDEVLRRRLLAEENEKGRGYLYERLKKVDAPAAAKIHPNDTRRLIRALEVFHLTGKPISSQQPERKGLKEEFHHRIFFMDRNRADLYERINRRVEAMFRQGLVREVKRVLKKKLSQTARMALGLREVEAYLKGECTLEAAKTRLKQKTRNYAKRQISWFRHERGVEFLSVAPDEPASKTARKILQLL